MARPRERPSSVEAGEATEKHTHTEEATAEATSNVGAEVKTEVTEEALPFPCLARSNRVNRAKQTEAI